MIISVYSEKTFNKIQHNLERKTLERLVVGGTYLNTLKVIYTKPIAITNLLNREKLKSIPTETGIGQGFSSYSPLLFNTEPEALE